MHMYIDNDLSICKLSSKKGRMNPSMASLPITPTIEELQFILTYTILFHMLFII